MTNPDPTVLSLQLQKLELTPNCALVVKCHRPTSLVEQRALNSFGQTVSERIRETYGFPVFVIVVPHGDGIEVAVEQLPPKCPHARGTDEYCNWWENYFRTEAIPKVIAEGEARKEMQRSLRQRKHGHDFGPQLRCRCGLTYLDYSDSRYPSVCPLLIDSDAPEIVAKEYKQPEDLLAMGGKFYTLAGVSMCDTPLSCWRLIPGKGFVEC